MMGLDASELQRRKKRWLVFTYLFGLMLAVAIVVGLSTTVSRLDQTMKLVDDNSISDTTYDKMVDRSIVQGQVGLAMGTLAFFGYLISFVMHNRMKEKIKAQRDEGRHLAILDELLEEGETNETDED